MDVPQIDITPTAPVVLRWAAAQFGDRDLLVTVDRRLTFAEAEARSRWLAGRLVAAGAGKGSRIGMRFAYGPDFIVSWLAVARIGAVVMPLSTAYTAHELGAALRRGDIETLIVPRELLGRDQLTFLEEAVPGLSEAGSGPLGLTAAPYLRRIWVIGDSDRPWATSIDLETPGSGPVPSDELLEAIESEVVPGDWLVVIQTSGSTAEPKAVIHTHGALFRKMGQGPGLAPIVYLGMPLFWVGGVIVLGSALTHGTTLLVQERFEPGEALDLMEREGATAVSAWFTILHALRTHPSLSERNLPAIPNVTVDPAANPYTIALGMTETMGPHLAVPSPAYGMDVPDHLRGSMGVSNDGFEHQLVDPDTGQVVEGDGEGEICVRGYALTVGMYKREREHVFDADGWYHTGDRVARREGLFFFTGRVTEMIKTRGSNVAPPEVEAAIESLPGVQHAFVVGIPHPELEEQVAAVVVPRAGETLDVGVLREGAGKLLSPYKVPRVVLLMDEADVPWLATGKPDKRAMRPLLEKLAAGL